MTRSGDAAGGVTLEVAHEVLLRQPPISQWLEADREFLIWRQNIARVRAGFDANRRGLLSGRELEVALSWIEARAEDLQDVDRAFIQDSLAADEAMRQIARKRERDLLKSVGLTIFVTLILLAAAFYISRTITTPIEENYEDPKLRHTIVYGAVNRDAWPIRDESLKALDAQLSAFGQQKRGERAAYGRIIGLDMPLYRVGSDGKRVGDPMNVRVLRLDKDEPITSAILVKLADGQETTLREALLGGTALVRDGTMPLVVLPVLRKKLARNIGSGAQFVPSELMIERRTAASFTIVGVAFEAPRNPLSEFDAIMSLDEHLKWMSQVDPDAIPGGRIPYYESVAVYFDSNSYMKTQALLAEQAYLFDDSILKFIRTLDEFLGIQNKLLLLLGTIGFTNIVVIISIINVYRRNFKLGH